MMAAQESILEPMLSVLDHYTSMAAAVVGERFKYIPVFAALQTAAFIIFFALMQQVNVSRGKRAEFTSCCISLMHNLVAIFGCGALLITLWPFHFDDPGTTDTHIVLQYSIAYMITDLFCFLLPFTPDDYLFVGHHFVTGAYMFDCVRMQRGAVSVLPWVFLGEVTGPLLNVFTACKELRKDSKVAQVVFSAVSPMFTVSFLLVRTLFLPPFLVWWILQVTYDCSLIPASHRVAWAVLITAGVVGSQVWSMKLIRGFLRNNKKRTAAAGKQE